MPVLDTVLGTHMELEKELYLEYEVVPRYGCKIWHLDIRLGARKGLLIKK